MSSFFNQEGYVLDFSDLSFKEFALDSVGEVVKENGLSKGKSFDRYIRNAPDGKAKKYIADLLQHYEDSSDFNKDREANNAHFKLYLKCKELVASWGLINISHFRIDDLKMAFNSQYINAQIDIMTKMQDENPTEAIGKVKELVESCCKTILTNMNIEYVKFESNFVKLINETFQALTILPSQMPPDCKEVDAIKRLLGNLLAIAQNIAVIRNSYGSGHGKESSYSGLEPRHAKLSVGACLTLVNFLWDSYQRTLPF
ncbi:MAG: abortive infection family protein [Pseudoflavonifractor sp.]|nr:abortive infection family protein [Pseudoflavonifractor sp.]